MPTSPPQSDTAPRTSPNSAQTAPPSPTTRSARSDARGEEASEDAETETLSADFSAGDLDDGDWRLLRALQASDHEWTARPDFQETPLDELRLHELKRAGYVANVGARFLWQLTDRGRALLDRRDDADSNPVPVENASSNGIQHGTSRNGASHTGASHTGASPVRDSMDAASPDGVPVNPALTRSSDEDTAPSDAESSRGAQTRSGNTNRPSPDSLSSPAPHRGDGRAGASPPEHSPPDQRRLKRLWPESGDDA